MLQVGDVVLYADPKRNVFPAMVTAVWSQDYINVVFVSDDKEKTDQYGRQIQRDTSVMRMGPSTKGGRCFRELDNEIEGALIDVSIGKLIRDFQNELDPRPELV